MINIPASLKKDLGQLAGVLNQFKSEAVQVKLLDQFLTGSVPTVQAAPMATATISAPARRGRPPGTGAKKQAAVRGPGRKRSKVGATGALNQLMDSGFFKAHRTIADVTEACKNKLGLEIAVTNLSGPLMRFVAEKKLVRAKNKDEKFEYWAK